MSKSMKLEEEKRKPRTTWLLNSEYEQLKAEAKTLNLLFSYYSRAILLKRPIVELRSEVDRRTYVKLGQVDNNLNQLVHQVNEDRLLGIKEDVESLRTAIVELTNAIVKILLKLASWLGIRALIPAAQRIPDIG